MNLIDQRKKFEEAVKSMECSENFPLIKNDDGAYMWTSTLALWMGWLLKVQQLMRDG